MSSPARKTITVTTDAEAIDRIRWTVAGLQAQGKPVTLAAAAADAFIAWAEAQEAAHNDGEAFPAAKVRPGRPLPELSAGE